MRIDFIRQYWQQEWRRGDVIAVENAQDYGYRNRAKVFWDGARTILPGGMEWEDSRTIPQEFAIGSEFHPLYWEDVWDNTYPYVWAPYQNREMPPIVDGILGLYRWTADGLRPVEHV